MNYYEAVNYIESLSPTQVKPGLERIRLFMKEEGNIQDLVPALHVGGTNGKGSVTAILAETLNQAGLNTGRYTGPHLIEMTERVEIANCSIGKEEFAAILTELKSKSESFARRHPEHGKLTWFELITAVAFFSFSERHTAAAVYEVGLGGQFDATNIISNPVCSCITNVSLDHTHILGNTVEEIAVEKAGIIKEGIPIVTGARDSALKVIRAKAQACNAPLICVDENLMLEPGSKTQEESRLVDALSSRFENLKVPIAASLSREQAYQRMNAALAATVLGIWELKTKRNCLESFEQALATYFWPGRLQYFDREGILLDGAHNKAGAAALKSSLDILFPEKKRCFVLSFYKSKQFKEILKDLLEAGDLVFCSEKEGKRSVVASAEIVEEAEALGAEAHAFETLEKAFEKSSGLPLDEYIKIGTGSFATVAAGMNFLGFQSVEDSRKHSRRIRS